MSKGAIFRNNAYYMVAGFLPSAVGFITLPLFSRVLSPEDYGVLALVQALSAFLPLIMTLQLPSSVRRFYFDYEVHELKCYVSTLFAAIIVVGGCMVVLLNVFLPEILSAILPQSSVGYETLFRIGVFTAFILALSNYNGLLLRVRQRAIAYMRVALVAFFIGLAVNLYMVVWLGAGAKGIVIGQFCSACVALVGYIFCNKGLYCLQMKSSVLKGAMFYAVPLILSALMSNVYFYGERIIMDSYVSLTAIGLYGFSGRIAWLFKKFVNLFNEAFLPRFMQVAVEDSQAATREAAEVADIFLFLLSMCLTVVALFTFEMLHIIFDPRYSVVWLMLPVLCSAYFFRSVYCFSVAGILFEKKTAYMPLITAIAAVINVTLNVLLIPRFGVMAAAWVMVGSFGISALAAAYWSRPTLFIPLKYGRICLYYAYFLVGLSVAWWVHSSGSPMAEWSYLGRLGVKAVLLIPGGALAYLHRRDILDLVRLLNLGKRKS